MPRLIKPSPLTKLAVGALEDLKAVDLKVLDVRKLTTITDTMVVCTGTSNRHVKSIASNLVAVAKHAGHQPAGVEGMEMGEWVLVNLGEVIVHIMQLQTRAFFQLEKLWELSPPPPDEPMPKPKTKRKAPAKKPTSSRKGAKKAGARAKKR